jgi:nucleolar protein 56
MNAFLASTVYGYFLVDENGKILMGVRETEESWKQKLTEEIRRLGLERVQTFEPGLAKYAELVELRRGLAEIYSHKEFAAALGLSEAEALEFVRLKALEETKKGIVKISGRRDRIIAQVINAVDEFDETLNIFASRIREWYGLHFPELGEIVEDNSSFLRLVSQVGLRESFTEEEVRRMGYSADTARKIAEKAASSSGAPISKEDFEPIRIMSEAVYQLYSLRNKLTGYIQRLMSETAPNLSGVAGAVLGARLIALAGDLERLAKFPSSTVQVLGAEKALFRAIRRGAKPPKHGVIFQDPLIHSAPRWQRGKIARAYAGKLSIAARVDFYGGEDVSGRLRSDFESRVKEIKTNFSSPPERESERAVKGGFKKKGRDRGRDRDFRRKRR